VVLQSSAAIISYTSFDMRLSEQNERGWEFRLSVGYGAVLYPTLALGVGGVHRCNFRGAALLHSQ
jgi:hypothetical protein